MKEKIMKELETVIDPEIGVDIVRMGMIKDVKVDGKNITIKFQPTTPFCPMISYLVENIEQAVKRIKGVNKVKVEVIR